MSAKCPLRDRVGTACLSNLRSAMHLSKGLRGCRGLRWTGILSSDVQSRAPAACRCQSSATPAAQPAPPAAGDRRARNHWDMIRLKEHERPPAMPVSEYARLDAARAARCTEPPTGVQMLTRDFVADALYNPQYGYFSKRANIFRWDEPPNFTSMKDELDFMDRVAALYAQLEPKSAHLTIEGTQQVWHTPVELFRPWYGHAVAKYIVSKHREQPGKDLVIFEVGGGNGTMMANIMDFIRDNEPELYPRTRYTIIEISEQLSRQQAKLLAEARAKHTRVSLVNKSIFDWNETVSDECFFIASEVIVGPRYSTRMRTTLIPVT